MLNLGSKRGVGCWKRALAMLAMERQLVGMSLMLKIRLVSCNNLGGYKLMLRMRLYVVIDISYGGNFSRSLRIPL
jgi:hypothetical protein